MAAAGRYLWKEKYKTVSERVHIMNSFFYAHLTAASFSGSSRSRSDWYVAAPPLWRAVRRRDGPPGGNAAAGSGQCAYHRVADGPVSTCGKVDAD